MFTHTILSYEYYTPRSNHNPRLTQTITYPLYMISGDLLICASKRRCTRQMMPSTINSHYCYYYVGTEWSELHLSGAGYVLLFSRVFLSSSILPRDYVRVAGTRKKPKSWSLLVLYICTYSLPFFLTPSASPLGQANPPSPAGGSRSAGPDHGPPARREGRSDNAHIHLYMGIETEIGHASERASEQAHAFQKRRKNRNQWNL